MFILYRNFFYEINHSETIQYRVVNENSVNSLIFNLSNTIYDEVMNTNNCDVAMENIDVNIFININ